MAQPLQVSVVVPTCLRVGLLERCLHALLAQTLPAAAYEIIVVDDGHDAPTQALVHWLGAQAMQPRVRCISSPAGPRGGPAAARNAGWRSAAAPLVAFTDDDTLPDANWLAEGLHAVAAGAVVVAGGVHVPAPAGGRPPTDHERMTQGLARAEFVTANAFVPRALLQEVGGFDERFKRAWREDSDLQFRLLQAGHAVTRWERARVTHPVRHESWGISVRQQRNTFFEPLLYAKHPRLYRERIRPMPPWNYYLAAAAALGLVGALLARQSDVAAAMALLLTGVVLELAWRRLRHTLHTPAHVLEMLITSAVIPFASLYWKWRGARQFKIWMW